ncbi:MAG: HupE/UreJ family protein, partial [Thauera sp.]|nr:HupE/UreJ family protein [Thauera sp.]
LAGASGTAFAHPGHAHGTDGFFNALIHAFTEPGVLLPLIAVGAYLGWRALRRPE